MPWDAPDRQWRFAIGGDPPADLPPAWAIAAHAVACDLACRRHGSPIDFTKVSWGFVVSDNEWLAVGFRADTDADVGTYERCLGYRLLTSTAQATVWLADDVQEQLTGHEFVQWPIAEQRVLAARVVDGQAVWIDPGTNTAAAPIGDLCAARDARQSRVLRQGRPGSP